jgi:hypothetical protein
MIPLNGPLPDRGVRLPADRANELMLTLDAIVSVRGTDGVQRGGKVTYIGERGVEIAYTDGP